jgi:CBS domain-containing protein
MRAEARLENMMHRPPRILAPDDPIDTTERLLRHEHSRHWPVAVDDQLVGVVSLRDVLSAQRPESDEERAQRDHPLKAAHVMLRAVAVGHPEDSPERAAALMLQYRLSCLPIVHQGKLLGLIHLDDLVKLALRRLRDRQRERHEPPRVSEVMTSQPIATVEMLEPLEVADKQMRAYNVRHLPVLHRGQLAGILSDRDLAEALLRSSEPLRERYCGEVMTAAPIVAAPKDEAIDGALVMLVQHIGALPVVEGRLLVGILTKSDFLRQLVHV